MPPPKKSEEEKAEKRRAWDRQRLANMSPEKKMALAAEKKAWREANLDRERENGRLRYHSNREDICAEKREMYAADIDESRARKKAKYDKAPEKYRAYQKAHRERHPEEIVQSQARYTENNKERLRLLQRSHKINNKTKISISDKKRYALNREAILARAKIRNADNCIESSLWNDEAVSTDIEVSKNSTAAMDIVSECIHVSVTTNPIEQTTQLIVNETMVSGLDNLFTEATLVDLGNLPTYRSGKNTIQCLCQRFCQNDVKDINYSLSGTPHSGSAVLAVGPMTADNFLLAAHVEPCEIVNNKYIKYNVIQGIIYGWLKGHGIEHVDVKPLQFSFDKKAHYGGATGPRPFATYKVATADANLQILLTKLSDPNAMLFLHQHSIYFYDIDIKRDYAACITPEVRLDAVHRASKYLPTWDMHLVDNLKLVGRQCITLISKNGLLRAKAYNKFAETLENPGVKIMIGDRLPRWADNTGKNLRSAICNDATQENGLTRIEYTIKGTVPTYEHCEILMTQCEQVFLHNTNKTPIREQWRTFCTSLRHTTVIYDCYSGQVGLIRWKNGLTNMMNGLFIRPATFMQLEHYVKLCVLNDCPIDFYRVTSDIKVLDTITRIPLGFQAFQTVGVFKKNVDRLNWLVDHIQLHRGPGYTKTHFLKNNSLYSSQLRYPDIISVGLVPNSRVTASVSERRFAKTTKLEFITLFTKEKKTLSNNNTTIPICDKIPAPGEHAFVRAFERRVTLPSHRKSDMRFCVELHTGVVYACYHPAWQKLLNHFKAGFPFTFYVLADETMSLLPAGEFPSTRALPLLKLEKGIILTVADTQLRYLYGSNRTVVQFLELATIPFLATDELTEMLLHGHVQFRAGGEVFNIQRKKVRQLIPI